MAQGERALKAEVRHRGAFRGPNGCLAADHPLAVSAGARMISAGGSAADAAVAMAAVMTVVQPYYSHAGGDLFALVYDPRTRSVEALNSSGPAPSSARLEAYAERGSIPDTGPLAVTIPGCVSGWWELHARYGRLPWTDVLDPAIRLAREGFPASRQLSAFVQQSGPRVSPQEPFQAVFARPAGGRVVQEEYSATLTAVADAGLSGFYSGAVADACIAEMARGGVYVSRDEWAPPARWEPTVSGPFLGRTLHTQPPPSQGFVLPLAMKLYSKLLDAGTGLAAEILQHAALAQAFEIRSLHAGDPDFVPFDAQETVDSADLGRLGVSEPVSSDGDTTYLLAADSDGLAVSLIQSIFAPFGSGVFVPSAGVFLNNRMCGFTLKPGHANALAPGKRPMHTLGSYVVLREDGTLAALGGTPGALQQPQTNLQVLDRVLRNDTDLQDALDAPRWSLAAFQAFDREYRMVQVEAHEPDTISPAFRDAGFRVDSVPAWHGPMGRASIAVHDEDGWAVAADIRGEGTALVF